MGSNAPLRKSSEIATICKAVFPTATITQDSEGQIIIATGYYVANYDEDSIIRIEFDDKIEEIIELLRGDPWQVPVRSDSPLNEGR